MAEQDKPFVVNDRRKFRLDGEPREPIAASTTEAQPTEADGGQAGAAEATTARPGPVPVPSSARDASAGAVPEPTNSAHLVTPVPEPAGAEHEASFAGEEGLGDDEAAAGDDLQRDLPAPPTPEEIEQVRAAYQQTTERLDTMMRSQNLGAEPVPPMDFMRLVQSIYMSAMIQLGAGTQQGQQARVDLIGAKQSIDMLAVIREKSGNNLSEVEVNLIESALFELRMGFLEITQLLARQAAAKQAPTAGPTGAGGGFGVGSGFTGAGPRIVR